SENTTLEVRELARSRLVRGLLLAPTSPTRSLLMSKLLSSVLTASCVLGLAATGCVKQDDPPEAIARAIPTSEQVRIKLPTNGRALGDLANYYIVSRDVTRTLNGGTGWVLVLIHAIVQYPVT